MPSGSRNSSLEPVENRLLDDSTVAQMLDDDALQEIGSNASVPDPLRIHGDDRSARADAEAWRLAALHPARAEEQPFPLKQLREERI